MSPHRPTIGFAIFPGFTGLDLVGPHEVLARTGARCLLVAATEKPVVSDRGLTLAPDARFDDAPRLEVLVVPGGPGQSLAMHDDALIAFIRSRASEALYVLGVCTGALLLCQAGVVRGRRATTHWLAQQELSRLGAHAVRQRVVWAGKIVTAAGVSSGIDAALELITHWLGPVESERIQLAIEYDPQPPHDAGNPDRARPELVNQLRRASRFAQPPGAPAARE